MSRPDRTATGIRIDSEHLPSQSAPPAFGVHSEEVLEGLLRSSDPVRREVSKQKIIGRIST
jgi:hypothetical protein